jgi:hypothetical protein
VTGFISLSFAFCVLEFSFPKNKGVGIMVRAERILLFFVVLEKVFNVTGLLKGSENEQKIGYNSYFISGK